MIELHKEVDSLKHTIDFQKMSHQKDIDFLTKEIETLKTLLSSLSLRFEETTKLPVLHNGDAGKTLMVSAELTYKLQ